VRRNSFFDLSILVSKPPFYGKNGGFKGERNSYSSELQTLQL